METLIFRGVITLYVLESEAGDGRGCASLDEVWNGRISTWNNFHSDFKEG